MGPPFTIRVPRSQPEIGKQNQSLWHCQCLKTLLYPFVAVGCYFPLIPLFHVPSLRCSFKLAMDDYLENLVSLERLSNARRPQAQPVDQLLEDSLAKVQKYLAAPVEEDVLVEDASKAHRQWLMRTWNE